MFFFLNTSTVLCGLYFPACSALLFEELTFAALRRVALLHERALQFCACTVVWPAACERPPFAQARAEVVWKTERLRIQLRWAWLLLAPAAPKAPCVRAVPEGFFRQICDASGSLLFQALRLEKTSDQVIKFLCDHPLRVVALRTTCCPLLMKLDREQ